MFILVAIELICECFNPKVDDEHLQLQIVKVKKKIVFVKNFILNENQFYFENSLVELLLQLLMYQYINQLY